MTCPECKPIKARWIELMETNHDANLKSAHDGWARRAMKAEQEVTRLEKELAKYSGTNKKESPDEPSSC